MQMVLSAVWEEGGGGIIRFGLVEMSILTNRKPTIYRNLYENTGPGGHLGHRTSASYSISHENLAFVFSQSAVIS